MTVHLLFESTTSIICNLDAGLRKKVNHVVLDIYMYFFLAGQGTFKGPGKAISNKTINNLE